jgi:cyclophilin family peptidyl-prolyl cis-trans isomerase
MVVWNDGKLPGHQHEPGHAGHSHDALDLRGISVSDTPEDKRRKASMTPEQRKEYDRQRAIAEREEALARDAYFAKLPDGDSSELAKEFSSAFETFRNATKELVVTLQKFAVADKQSEEEIDAMQSNWLSVVANCNKAKATWVSKAAALYVSDPDKYGLIGKSLKEMLLFDAERDRFDGWREATPFLAAPDLPIMDEVFAIALAMTCVANNDYEVAQAFAEGLIKKGILPEQQQSYLGQLSILKDNWEKEKGFRESDLARSNPRVEFITSKGRIVIELFEDDAPEATKNIVYLVEKGFYNRKSFFRVEQHSVIQTGCEKGDGSGDAGYTFREPANKRKHFRGSCGIALGSSNGIADPDSGSSQFYIACLPLNHLDADYAVFGRVVEGLEILGLLRRLNLAKEEERKENKTPPDFIISAKVLNKRDHDYTPTVVRGKLYR